MQISCPTIEPLSKNTERPFWSVMITAYSRTNYLESCLRSVLDQSLAPHEMQIEVMDDCSPNRDEIKALVESIGKGRISFYSAPENAGIFANWNACIQRSKGRWVHILSDDDRLAPGFYHAHEDLIDRHHFSAIATQSIIINEHDQWIGVTEPLQKSNGLLKNAHVILAKPNPIRTPGIVVAREAYEKVGGFTTDLVYTPDWEMWSRLAVLTEVGYINTPYSFFRQHSHSETNRLILSGESVTDTLLASKTIQARLQDPQDKEEVRQAVVEWLHISSFSISKPLVSQKHYRAALLHAFWAFRLRPSPGSFKNIGVILIKISISLLKQSLLSVSTHTETASENL